MIRKAILTVCCFLIIGLSACAAGPETSLPPTAIPSVTPLPTATIAPQPSSTATTAPSPTLTPSPSPTVRPPVPNFKHIVVIFLENHEFDLVFKSREMPVFNQYALQNTLLTQYYAVTHPSLPNYLAVFGGDTFGVKTDCGKCFVSAPNLADQIEASGRTWKAYFQDMPRPCFAGDTDIYVQKHNPFMYFDSVRLDPNRCNRSILPLGQLDKDLAQGTLPDFMYIMPNSCVSTDDDFSNPGCNLRLADGWLAGVMDKLLAAMNPKAESEPYLIVLTWDEGQGNHSCCGLPAEAGGRVATVLVSPQAKSGFQDATPYTHYSLLKTIETAWGLPFLGHAADENNVLITAPWK